MVFFFVLFYFVPQSLNELLETADAPFEVITGFIQTISLTVPWAALLQENCALEIKGLEMVLRPRPRVGKDIYIYIYICPSTTPEKKLKISKSKQFYFI